MRTYKIEGRQGGDVSSYQYRPMSRRSFLTALPLILAACSGPPHRKDRLQTSINDLSVHDEIEMTRHLLLKFRGDFPALQDAQVQEYVSSLGDHLVRRNNLYRNPYEYTFTVVDSPLVNAFALPAGKIFVTAPLIRLTENEAELAGALGHEIAHVMERHITRRLLELKHEKDSSWWYGGGGAVAGALLGVGASSLICGQGDSTCTTMFVTGGGGMGAQSGLLLQKYRYLEHSLANEMAADQLGLRYAVEAGYHPHHVGEFFRRLHQKAKKNPKGDKRVKRILELSKGFELRPEALVTSAAFEQIRERLTI